MSMKCFPRNRCKTGESPRVDGRCDQLRDQVGEDSAGLDGHHLTKTVNRIFVDPLALLKKFKAQSMIKSQKNR